MRTPLLLLGLILFLNAGSIQGQERLPLPKEATPLAPPPEAIPVPPAIVPGPVVSGPVAFYRVSAYQHWQYLSPDASGRWSPRVLTTPQGTVWAATGQWYPWGTIRPYAVRAPGTVPGP